MSLQALDDAMIEKVSADHNLLQNVVSAYTVSSPGMAQIMAGLVQKDPRLADLAKNLSPQRLAEDLGPQLDLDKCWQGLHYLFTGSAWEGEEPLCYLLHKGCVIGECNGSEVRAISSDLLMAFENGLQSIDKEEILRRYDGKAMAEADIYLADMWERDTDEGREYVCEKLRQLKEFLKDARSRGKGMIIWLT